MSPATLSGGEVDAVIVAKGLTWTRDGTQLSKTIRCKGFAGALAFVNEVGALAEEADHHPDIDIRWDTVTLRLTTHSAHGLTEKDLALAEAIDHLAPPSFR